MSSPSQRQPSGSSSLQETGQPFSPADQTGSDASQPEANQSSGGRQQPIPPPSEPMQYRAIGLIRGRYVPSSDPFNRGCLQTTDGTLLDAVLLGQVMSLVKKHLDLAAEHLWVVYPRTRENQASLHVQIVGVWEPEVLQPSQGYSEPGNLKVPIDDYFSIRGEVLFQSQEQSYIVVRIQQSPRKRSQTPKSFKLRLEGDLPTRALGYFWDLDVRRQGNELVILQGQAIARVPPKKPAHKSKRPARGGQRQGASPRPTRPGSSYQTPRPPVSKPIKRNNPRPTGN